MPKKFYPSSGSRRVVGPCRQDSRRLLTSTTVTLLLALSTAPSAYAGVVAPKDRPHQGGSLQYGCKTDDCVMIEGIRRMNSNAPADRAEQKLVIETIYNAQVTAPPFIPPESRAEMVSTAQDMLSALAKTSALIVTVTLHRFTHDDGNLFCGTAIYGGRDRGRFVLALHSTQAASGYNTHADADTWMRSGCNGEGLALR